VGNEPNLAAVECWKPYSQYTYNGTTGHIAFVNLLYDQWGRNADKIRRLGGIPLFPAMSPTAYTSSDVFFHHALYEQIIGLGKLRGDLAWAFEGAGIAIHNRPSENPLDAVDKCAFKDYEWIEQQFRDALGREMPLFGTEAGYEDGMVGSYILHQLGNLYPNNDDFIRYHKLLNHEMFARFNPQHPKAWADYLICECAWLAADDGWYASGWARNARMPNSGPLPSFTDMGQISRFTRAEGAPYEPPEEEEEPVPGPDLPPGTDEVEFVNLSQEMIDMLSVSGPPDPSQPYWKVTAVEVQPQTDNMNAWVLVPDKPHPTPVFFWPGMEVPMEWKGPDPLSPPGCQNGAYAQVMHHCWGSFGVRMDGNTETLFGIGLYGANLEPTYTGHHPVLVYFEQVSPAEPEPDPEPPTPEPPPEPMPDIPYRFVDALNRRLKAAGLPALLDLRQEIGAKYARMSLVGKRSNAASERVRSYKSIDLHHTAATGPLNVMRLAEYHWKPVAQGGRGYDIIAYHLTDDELGQVTFAKAFALWSAQAGVTWVNKTGIAVAVQGNFVSGSPTNPQLKALKCIVESVDEWVGEAQGKPYPLPILPHKAIVDTQCPGNLYEKYIAWRDL